MGAAKVVPITQTAYTPVQRKNMCWGGIHLFIVNSGGGVDKYDSLLNLIATYPFTACGDQIDTLKFGTKRPYHWWIV